MHPIFIVSKRKMVRVLELFSGTGSVGRYLRENFGWEVISLDICPKSDATHVCDILLWDELQYTPGHFDFCWASPPCTMFSIARTTASTPRDIDGATRIVQRTRDIIANLQIPWFVIENPQSGLLKVQPVVSDLPFFDTDYCAHGQPFRKRTRLWSNLPLQGLPLCPGPGLCHAMVGRQHQQTAQRGPGKALLAQGIRDRCPLTLLHTIPGPLVEMIAHSLMQVT